MLAYSSMAANSFGDKVGSERDVLGANVIRSEFSSAVEWNVGGAKMLAVVQDLSNGGDDRAAPGITAPGMSNDLSVVHIFLFGKRESNFCCIQNFSISGVCEGQTSLMKV